MKVALDSIKNRDFKSAIKSLKTIIKTSKDSETIANASYFLAVSYAANGQYKEAVVTARKFVAANPENKYAPDALRTMYIAQNQLNWKQSAINTANTLFKKYPDSDAAKKVKQDLNNK
ncbi:MAG TPA: outer membrane protein assembly factor BamD [Burkholderiales bacterium]|nr:outer membrane protein assembly factor BamD [Burkholderiales bacterium]